MLYLKAGLFNDFTEFDKRFIVMMLILYFCRQLPLAIGLAGLRKELHKILKEELDVFDFDFYFTIAFRLIPDPFEHPVERYAGAGSSPIRFELNGLPVITCLSKLFLKITFVKNSFDGFSVWQKAYVTFPFFII